MNQGVDGLPDKSQASIAAARLLLGARHLDSAASRVYYAMFYVTEELLVAMGQSTANTQL